MPNPHATTQRRSGFHSVKNRKYSGHGGSGSPVRISAGVRASEPASSATGVAVRASAAATPDARPMNDQFADDEPPERAGRARPIPGGLEQPAQRGVSRPAAPDGPRRLHDGRHRRAAARVIRPIRKRRCTAPKQPERDERRDLDEDEAAVRRGEFIEIADAQRRARIARQRHDDEADERDRGVPREHDRQPLGAERTLAAARA